MKLRGIAVSGGYAVGKIIIYRPFRPVFTRETIGEENVSGALNALDAALRQSAEELREIISRFERGQEKKSKIFSAHLEILEDEEILCEAREAIAEDHLSAGTAVSEVYGRYISLMGGRQDVLLKERAADLTDVRNRILRNLAGIPEVSLQDLGAPGHSCSRRIASN
jgi:phosphotransferase system enzyme I (PtsI)